MCLTATRLACQIENRLTYFRAEFDDQARLVCAQKLVYGGVEMEHRYSYCPDGRLKRAEIADAEGEIRTLEVYGPWRAMSS